VAIQFEYPDGATPLDTDEAIGLIPGHIATQAQLNEWEFANVLNGEMWAFDRTSHGRRRKYNDTLSLTFVRELHLRMFGATWTWAGTFRQTEKNIGIDPLWIQTALVDLLSNTKTQLEFRSYSLDEIAARLSHRLVAIHPFVNGNGRLSRTLADIILVENGGDRFSWGAINLTDESLTRQRYLAALREADAKNYTPLLAFVRS
jgi:Fic-DOC domain mobile mystery protein B